MRLKNMFKISIFSAVQLEIMRQYVPVDDPTQYEEAIEWDGITLEAFKKSHTWTEGIKLEFILPWVLEVIQISLVLLLFSVTANSIIVSITFKLPALFIFAILWCPNCHHCLLPDVVKFLVNKYKHFSFIRLDYSQT